MNRRTFLKIAGMGSISFAFGCNPPQKNLFSQVQMPDDMVTGKATWYASTCRECPAGCGIMAKSREARIVKIEGNPLHPINKGKLCMRGQAALQGVLAKIHSLGLPLLLVAQTGCPCPSTNCPRHGQCRECAVHYAARGGQPFCFREKTRWSKRYAAFMRVG